MIYYICTTRKQYVFSSYLSSWGIALQSRFRLLTYDEFFKLRRLPRATYVFTDIERLSARQREGAAEIWNHLKAKWPEIKLFNHPLRLKKRYPLLRELHQSGINRFDVYRVEENRRPECYPVFIRRANDHSGPETELLNSEGELESAERLLQSKIDAEDLIITEFCATPDSQKRYWKYSAFIFQDQIVPVHIFVADTWCVKVPTVIDNEIIAAEYDYVTGNPHEQVLRQVARIGNIDYGRIDYGLVDGQVQVYEVNTHPQVMGREDYFFDQRQRAREFSAKRLEKAFAEMDSEAGGPDLVRPPKRPKVRWWRDPGAGYIFCKKVMKSIGRESASPSVFQSYRRIKYFCSEKIYKVWTLFVALKSRMAGRGSRR